MKRPSARATQAHRASPLMGTELVHSRQMAALKAKRARRDQRVLEYVRREGPCYCVEVADSLVMPPTTAVSILRRLDDQGALTSTKEPAPRSGLGRRYYRATEDR